LKRASRCFQNFGILTLERSMVKTDMCKCLAIMDLKKKNQSPSYFNHLLITYLIRS
jgi:hypothetical protein